MDQPNRCKEGPLVGGQDQCVTSGGLAGSRVAPSKRAYKRKRNGEQSPVSSRTASWYLKHSQKLCDREIGGGSGPEKGAGEGGWEERGNQMSKGGEVDQFHEGNTRTFSSEETGGLDQPDRCKEGPLIGGQGVSTEEPGDGQGESKG